MTSKRSSGASTSRSATTGATVCSWWLLRRVATAGCSPSTRTSSWTCPDCGRRRCCPRCAPDACRRRARSCSAPPSRRPRPRAGAEVMRAGGAPSSRAVRISHHGMRSREAGPSMGAISVRRWSMPTNGLGMGGGQDLEVHTRSESVSVVVLTHKPVGPRRRMSAAGRRRRECVAIVLQAHIAGSRVAGARGPRDARGPGDGPRAAVRRRRRRLRVARAPRFR
jgi:hypothetical protein